MEYEVRHTDCTGCSWSILTGQLGPQLLLYSLLHHLMRIHSPVVSGVVSWLRLYGFEQLP